MRIVSNTGAYGNHGGPVLFHSTGESVDVYRCPNKKIDGYAVYTNTVPAGAFRGYGLPPDHFRDRVGDGRAGAPARHGPVRLPAPQRHASGRPDDGPTTMGPTTWNIGSYGLDQCLDIVEARLAGVPPSRTLAMTGSSVAAWRWR